MQVIPNHLISEKPSNVTRKISCDLEVDDKSLMQPERVKNRDPDAGETCCECGDFDECECERNFEDML